MKLKRVRIAVEPLSQTQARWKKAIGGKSVSKREVITVASWEVLGKVLSPPRLEILARCQSADASLAGDRLPFAFTVGRSIRQQHPP